MSVIVIRFEKGHTKCIDTFPRNKRDYLVFLVETGKLEPVYVWPGKDLLSSEHPSCLPWCSFNLDRYTSSYCRLLDQIDGFVLFLQTRTDSQLTSAHIKIVVTTYIFPSLIISLTFVALSNFTTPTGVPTRIVPSMISHPRMIGSRWAKAWIIDNRTGQTAVSIASRFRASMTSARYFWNASNRW